MKNTAVIILAAGKGTRMKSATAKVLHCIREKPMIQYVTNTAVRLAGSDVIVVVGTQADQVKAVVSEVYPDVRFAFQKEQLGTGHAVLCAIPELCDNIEHVLILCGDVPFLKLSTLTKLIDAHIWQKNIITLVGSVIDNPRGYGRLIIDPQNRVSRIVEEADATADEKTIKLINTGIYCVHRRSLETMIRQVRPDNTQNEIYLTDIIEIASKQGAGIGMVKCEDSNEILGINTIHDLEKAESVLMTHEKP